MTSVKPLTWLILLFAVISLIGCTSQTTSKVLSTLFDGVPDTSSAQVIQGDTLASDPSVASGVPQRSLTLKPARVFHPPYQEKLCDACHDMGNGNRLLEQQPALCYQCHEDFNDAFAFLHGPVASGFCTSCHSPHTSKNKKLVVRKEQKLCLYCHESADVSRNEIHEAIGDVNCIDCHNPHGGEEEYFLN